MTAAAPPRGAAAEQGADAGATSPAADQPTGAVVAPVDEPPKAFQGPRLVMLTRRAQFLFVAQGVSAARGAVVVQMRPRPPEPESEPEPEPEPAGPGVIIGMGFTATKKIGGAVIRNRAKRRLREAARALLPIHGDPFCDYVFVARSGTPDRAWPRLLDDVKSALISLRAGGDPPRGERASGRNGARHGSRRPKSPPNAAKASPASRPQTPA